MKLTEFQGSFSFLLMAVHFCLITEFSIAEESVTFPVFDKMPNKSQPLNTIDLFLPNFNFNFTFETEVIRKGVLLGGRCSDSTECQIWEENAVCYSTFYDDKKCHCKVGYKRRYYQCIHTDPNSHLNYTLAKQDTRILILIIAITVAMAIIGGLILIIVRKCQGNQKDHIMDDFRRVSVNSHMHLTPNDQVVINCQNLNSMYSNQDKPPSYDTVQLSPPSYDSAIEPQRTQVSRVTFAPENPEKVSLEIL